MTAIKTQPATDPVETFLKVNAHEIQPANRAKIREMAAKAIQDENAAVDLRRCPEHLRDALRRIIVEAAYRHRVKGKRFNPNVDYMPTQGFSQNHKTVKCRI